MYCIPRGMKSVQVLNNSWVMIYLVIKNVVVCIWLIYQCINLKLVKCYPSILALINVHKSTVKYFCQQIVSKPTFNKTIPYESLSETS